MMRYTRHIRLTGFGERSQERVENSKILVIGAGGLGSPVLLYLAAAGVGTLGIVDDDVVDISNLQRQVLHTSEDEGILKTQSAEERLTALNPHVHIERHPYRITSENAAQIASSYDLVIDCSDNFQTRYLIDRVCEQQKIPHVWGAVIAYYGQVSVFLHDGLATSATLQDIYPQSQKYEDLPSPGVKGTFGPLCGMVGSFMAAEALKIVAGVGSIMAGKLALIDVFNSDLRTIPIIKRSMETVKD
ncbi:HesA/MoeB/ThiF family protein [Arcanobacterium phocae]|uniref:HesA/MoeB/ThiF family protein n=1 Tax=Arcanobacterium phocae TaxID=131112 RepID=UPI00209E900D|nr:HesA/MoeB/ThiF family protein [Arcanobacterium phocae]